MDFTKILATVAPWIGTALGGPLGGLAVTAAANAFGLTDKTTDALKTALGGATPEQMLALKQADQAFAVQMQALGFKQITDLEALAADDRKDARDMQKTTRSWVPAALSVIITMGFLGLLTGMMTAFFKADDNQAMLLLIRPFEVTTIFCCLQRKKGVKNFRLHWAGSIMLGALGVAFGQVTNFWLGSTAESGRKTEIIAQSPAKEL